MEALGRKDQNLRLMSGSAAMVRTTVVAFLPLWSNVFQKESTTSSACSGLGSAAQGMFPTSER